MKRNIIALLVVVMVLCCCLTLAACNNKTNVLDNYIFEMDGTTVSDDFVLPATIGGEKAEWKSNNGAVQIQKRESDVLAKVTLPEKDAVEVTLTVTVKKESKSYTVRVKALDVYDFMNNYVFPKNKATIVDNFDLETEFAYRGKKATIAWSVDENYELYIKVINDGKTLQVTPQGQQTPVEIRGTFTYGTETASQSYRMTVYKEMKGMELVNYWYTNTDVSVDMSGYVVAIAVAYSDSYGNVSLYMVNDDFTAGYYVYRVKTTAEHAAKLKSGVHVTVTGTTNTNYNGLVETNAGGTLVVDDDKPAINVAEKVYAIDEEVLGNLPTTIYHESRLVSLTNWKVKGVCAEADKKEGDNFTLMTLTKGGVDVDIRISKYMEGSYVPKKGNTTFDALWKLTDTYPVGTMVNVTGILSQYKGVWQIMPLTAAAVTASGQPEDGEDTVYAGKKVATAIAKVNEQLVNDKINDKKGKTVRITSEKEFTLVTANEGVTVEYEVVGKSTAIVNADGKMKVTPGNPETATIMATYTVGEFKSIQFFFVESLIPTAASMLEDLDVPETINAVTELPAAPKGATIEWKVMSQKTSIAISNGQLIPTLKEKDVATIVNATLTYDGVTRSKDYVVIVKAGKGSVEVKAPFEEGKGYVLTVDQTNLAKQIFAVNAMDGYYIKSNDNPEKVELVYVEKVEEGYKLYFKTVNKDNTETKTYIAYGTDGEHANILLDKKGENTNVWKWNAEKECFVCTMTVKNAESDYYLGANYGNDKFRLNQVKEGKPYFNENNFRAYLGQIKFVPLAEYNVTVATDSSANAQVKLNETKGVNGQKFTFTVKVDEGYEIVAVKVNGTEVEAVENVYTGVVKGATSVTVQTKQIGAEDPNKKTIPEALAAADGTDVVVTGYVKEINTAWNTNFKNMTVTIADDEGNTLYVFRLSTQVNLNDIITVSGKMASHNGNRQIGAGATAEIIGQKA